MHWTGPHAVTNVQRFGGRRGGDGDDCIFELSPVPPGSLASGLNVGTRINGTIPFTFVRELFFS